MGGRWLPRKKKNEGCATLFQGGTVALNGPYAEGAWPVRKPVQVNKTNKTANR